MLNKASLKDIINSQDIIFEKKIEKLSNDVTIPKRIYGCLFLDSTKVGYKSEREVNDFIWSALYDTFVSSVKKTIGSSEYFNAKLCVEMMANGDVAKKIIPYEVSEFFFHENMEIVSNRLSIIGAYKSNTLEKFKNAYYLRLDYDYLNETSTFVAINFENVKEVIDSILATGKGIESGEIEEI